MHIQSLTGINAEQKRTQNLKAISRVGAKGQFREGQSNIPQRVTEHVSGIGDEMVKGIRIDRSGLVSNHPPKITIVDFQFVISDHSKGLVYNYQVVSIDGAWSISLSSIVG